MYRCVECVECVECGAIVIGLYVRNAISLLMLDFCPVALPSNTTLLTITNLSGYIGTCNGRTMWLEGFRKTFFYSSGI
jgi:hypothetical protein